MKFKVEYRVGLDTKLKVSKRYLPRVGEVVCMLPDGEWPENTHPSWYYAVDRIVHIENDVDHMDNVIIFLKPDKADPKLRCKVCRHYAGNGMCSYGMTPKTCINFVEVK